MGKSVDTFCAQRIEPALARGWELLVYHIFYSHKSVIEHQLDDVSRVNESFEAHNPLGPSWSLENSRGFTL